MGYLDIKFPFFVFITLIFYYLLGMFWQGTLKAKIQQIILLISSFCFYYLAVELDCLILFCSTIIISFLFARALANANSERLRKVLLALGITISCAPLLVVKIVPWFASASKLETLIIPLGLSFYTLQIVAYLADCYNKKISPETNILRYALFISFFPQIVQGPIPRYAQLAKQFEEPHDLSPDKFTHGFQLILWGYFLKYMIAEKAAIPVNLVFDNYTQYAGFQVLIAASLYSIQLYTDFYSCVCLCRGVSLLFGIELMDNFRRPYFSLSMKELWARWHITLSTWLRDYIYIPLGGSRKGATRKYLNILIVFLVSGLWHGNNLCFIVWGIIHAFYQIFEAVTLEIRNEVYNFLKIDQQTVQVRIFKRIIVFILSTFAWIFFRAGHLDVAFTMLRNMFADFNPWVLFGKSRFSLGLDVHDVIVLSVSMFALLIVSTCQELNLPIRRIFCQQNIAIRWAVYFFVITAIWIFGAYGYGFNAADFIYGGF